MTTMPPSHLRLIAVGDGDRYGARTVRLELHGYLDYDSAEHLLEAATQQITDHPHLRDLHLDCAGLGGIDSMGLSVLLMIHRRTGAAGVNLHLDDRTPPLDRLLTLTGTLDHFTGSPNHGRQDSYPDTPAGDMASPADRPPYMSARSTGPDSSA